MTKALRRGARALLGEGSEDGDESDDEFTDDEEVHTPIDPVDPYVFFADALAGLQAHMPARCVGRRGRRVERKGGRGWWCGHPSMLRHIGRRAYEQTHDSF